MITLPLEYYEKQQKERDQALQGLMMYRYKFEEAERQLKLLPAPVEMVNSRLEELERQLQKKELELQRERSLPWWKRLFGNK